MCNDKSAPLYKSSFCELIRSLQNKSSISAALNIILFCVVLFLTFILFEQDSHFLAYIPSGKFFTVIDILLPFIAIAIFFLIHNNKYSLENKYGDKLWIHKQSLKRRKFLRVLSNIIMSLLFIVIFYYISGIAASFFPQKYTLKKYNIKVTAKDRGYKGGCKYRLKTDLLNKINSKKQPLFLQMNKSFNFFRLCVDSNTYNNMNTGELVNLKTRESNIWGIYVVKVVKNKP